MNELFVDHVTGLVSSPWIYLALLTVAALDGFFPIVPSETLVITAGVFAAHGEVNLALVIVVAAVGACLGDHVSYAIGRSSGARLTSGLRSGTGRHAAYRWASRSLDERGGLVLVVARYIPGGRTAVTLTMGAVAYRLRHFSFFAVIAAVCWALYSALVGYVGGAAFEEKPLHGVLLGIGLALGITIIVEIVRYRRRRGGDPVGDPPRGLPRTQ